MKIHDHIKNSNYLIRIFGFRKKRCFQNCSLRSKRFRSVSEQSRVVDSEVKSASDLGSKELIFFRLESFGLIIRPPFM